MIDEIKTDKEYFQELQQLEEFSTQWQSPHKKIEDIWTSFRLLPLRPAYLIASHYAYDKCGWSLTPKWELYKQFDKALLTEKNPNKISSSITSALETQRKIVSLQKVFATLKDPAKTVQEKACVYQDLQTQNAALYQDILHKIWIAKGKPENKEVSKEEISRHPDDAYSIAVIKHMLFLYKNGYSQLKDTYFENQIVKK